MKLLRKPEYDICEMVHEVESQDSIFGHVSKDLKKVIDRKFYITF